MTFVGFHFDSTIRKEVRDKDSRLRRATRELSYNWEILFGNYSDVFLTPYFLIINDR